MAKWIYSPETVEGYEHWTCSRCMHDLLENPKFRNRITGESLDFAYCPFCGDRMENTELPSIRNNK